MGCSRLFIQALKESNLITDGETKMVDRMRVTFMLVAFGAAALMAMCLSFMALPAMTLLRHRVTGFPD